MASFEHVQQQWTAGERRLRDAPPDQRPALHRVTDEVHAELRRRLGSRFTVDELVALYDRGTDWAMDLAFRIAPGAPWAWDPRTTTDAAFARYVRDAEDYAGGRRILREEQA